MKLVDFRQFAAPLSEDAPSGPDLEYDADFIKVIEILTPPPVAMVAVEGDVPADKTDWNGAVALCQMLAGKTRDLRVAVRLARCVAKSEQGISGFAGAVDLIADLVEHMWDDVHPVLDVEDNMDATMRLNALNELGDATVVRALNSVAIAVDGRDSVSLNDIEISIGKAKASSADEQDITSGRINDMFSTANLEKVVTAKAVADSALVAIERIRTTWSEKMDALAQSRNDDGLNFDNMPAPQFEALTRVLGDISRHIAERMPEIELQEDLSEGGDVAAGKSKASGVITTRADADRAILNIVEWFRRNEPSSPVPIMLERARSMISKSFLEIVDDLGDGGIAEAKKTAGVPNVEE